MPFTRPRPERPHRVWTFSRDRLCLSSGGGLWACAFGAVFTSSGLFMFVVFGRVLLSDLGMWPLPDVTAADEPFWKTTAVLAGLLALAVAHLACGTLLLWTLRTTFDRRRGTVRVRTGWLGLRCRREELSAFNRVIVCPNERPTGGSNNSYFDIVLDGESRPLVVGFVTLSHPLALEVAAEIAQFTGLATN